MILQKLRYIAIFGGFFALGSAGYFTRKIQGGFRDAEYYKKSTKMLRMYRPAVENFGEPIRTKNIDLGDKKSNFVDGFIARMTIPVYGPKGKGTLFLRASREDVSKGWEIDQLDLEIEKTKQKGTFYRRKNKDADADSISDESSKDNDNIESKAEEPFENKDDDFGSKSEQTAVNVS